MTWEAPSCLAVSPDRRGLAPMKLASDPCTRRPVVDRIRRHLGAMLLGAAGALAPAAAASAAEPLATSANAPSLGATTVVFDPSMPVSEIQATADGIYARQVDNEM